MTGLRLFDTFRRLGLESRLYVVLFVGILFSGSLYGSVVPYLIVLEAVLLSWMAVRMYGKRPSCHINTVSAMPVLLLLMFSAFLALQAEQSYTPAIGLSYARRFLLFSLFLVLVPRPDVSFCAIKASKYYSFVVAISILMMAAITGQRAGGLVGDYQFAGMMMSVACILFLIDYFTEGGKRLDAIGAALSLAGLLISGKRMFALVVVVSFIALYLLSRRRVGSMRVIRLLVAGSVLIVPAYFLFTPIRALFVRMQLLLLDPYTATSGRNLLWEAALEVFRGHPLTGIGFGSFPAWIGVNYGGRGIGQYLTHSIYYGLLAETGVVGFTLVIALLVGCLGGSIRLLVRVKRAEDALLQYLMVCSVAFQSWFVIYGLSGNGIYGWHEMFIYICGVAIMIAVRVQLVLSQEGQSARVRARRGLS